MRFKDKKKIAIVLSGGGVKAAAFHMGVCLALEEKGFKFTGGYKHDAQAQKAPEPMSINTYVGSSAGSIIGTALAAGYSIQDIIDAYLKGSKSKEYKGKKTKLKPLTYWDVFNLNSPGILNMLPTSWRTKSLLSGGFEVFLKHGFKMNGLFNAKGIEKYFRNHVLKTNNFSQLSSELYIVATKLNYSSKVVFGPFTENKLEGKTQFINYANISDAVAASASLPPVFAPYGIDKYEGETVYFFDGEIRDTLSTHVASDQGADLVISSYSVQPYNYNKKMGSLHSYGIPVILNQALYQVIEQKIEKHIEHREEIRSVIAAVEGYLKQINLEKQHRDKLMEIIEGRLEHDHNADFIYIHPQPQDYQFFFADHFSLSPETLKSIIRTGFRSTLRTLRKHDL